ncbi:hypothetical protein E6C27_scaffold708G00370 [Cucumis melo var. makuwa]|uniref:Uncharacterized protein n=1 Tax=Cucumis melo var. makuwa TaxID=1194695 RepID=A0A5A7SQG6_CUCMM|nr:hypothetical protein E6C27_scaffold708G00370 [Cucumis melo var. makuwa]
MNVTTKVVKEEVNVDVIIVTPLIFKCQHRLLRLRRRCLAMFLSAHGQLSTGPPRSPPKPYFPPSTSGHGESSVRIVFDEFPNVATSDSSLNIGTRFGPTFHPLKVDPLSVDSIEGHNRVSGNATASCSLCAIGCKELLADRPRCWMYVVVIGLNIDHGVGRGRTCTLRICASFGSTRLICASFGSTRLICASFESTRLICASLGITRLIGVSFGITRLICAFYGTIRLLCRVRVQRGANRREAGRMREGHMDASGFLYASADVRNENKIVSDSNIKMPLPLKTILRFVENVMDKDSGIRYQLPFLLFGIGRKTCVL